jgi:phage gp29-like protein
MPKQSAPLQDTGTSSVLQPPSPSSLAFGLNIETVVSVQNHWREYYNPLRALDLQRAIALYDFSRRGLNAELQNCYREMEMLYPTLIGLIERRTSPLEEMDTKFTILPQDKWPSNATPMLADDQAATLRDAYGQIDNLEDAIEWLELGAFRGYAHLEKIYANPGSSDLSVAHLEPVEQWHWTRKSMYAEWEYVAAATQTNCGVPINQAQFIIREVRRPLDRIALILWIRANLCEKDWDGFIEIVGIPKWIIIMPPNVPKELESEYLAAARSIANGGSGALPNGSDAKSAAPTEKSGSDSFRPRLDWLQEQLILAGTGGLLSMLALPTGMNDSQGAQHADAFKQLGNKEARRISKVFNRDFDAAILDAEFPGLPRLAKFELATREINDPAQFIAGVLQLSQAGYQTSPAQIEEKTGYEVTLKSKTVGRDSVEPKNSESHGSTGHVERGESRPTVKNRPTAFAHPSDRNGASI